MLKRWYEWLIIKNVLLLLLAYILSFISIVTRRPQNKSSVERTWKARQVLLFVWIQSVCHSHEPCNSIHPPFLPHLVLPLFPPNQAPWNHIHKPGLLYDVIANMNAAYKIELQHTKLNCSSFDHAE